MIEERAAAIVRTEEIDAILNDLTLALRAGAAVEKAEPTKHDAPVKRWSPPVVPVERWTPPEVPVEPVVPVARLCACGCGKPAEKRVGRGGAVLRFAVGHTARKRVDEGVIRSHDNEYEVVASGRNLTQSSAMLGSTLAGGAVARSMR